MLVKRWLQRLEQGADGSLGMRTYLQTTQLAVTRPDSVQIATSDGSWDQLTDVTPHRMRSTPTLVSSLFPPVATAPFGGHSRAENKELA